MAEQSSTAVAIRACVMLGCLVAIPLVAVFGNALPEAIDQVMGTWWTPRATARIAETAEEAPLFEPLRASPLASVPASSAVAWPSERPAERAMSDPLVCDSDGCRVLPATYEAPSEPARGWQPPQGPMPGHADPAVLWPHEQPGTPSPDQFQLICQRLRELGSTYVLLESWGDGQEQFRFYCKIAIAGNPHYTYRFEATSPDPLTAMARVLSQVEAWRAARHGN